MSSSIPIEEKYTHLWNMMQAQLERQEQLRQQEEEQQQEEEIAVLAVMLAMLGLVVQ